MDDAADCPKLLPTSPPPSSTSTNLTKTTIDSPLTIPLCIRIPLLKKPSRLPPNLLQPLLLPQSTVNLTHTEAPITPTHHNLSPATCPIHIYFTLQVLPKSTIANNPTDQQRIDSYCNSLVDALKALYKIDETIALWPFSDPLAPKSALLTNAQSLGHSIHQLTCYFDFLQIQNNFPPCYVHILLSFSMKMEDFMENVHLMFADIHANLYKRPFQVAQFTYLGWLLGSHEDLFIPTLETLLQETILKVAMLPTPTPKLGLMYEPIWDSTKKSDQEKEKVTTKCGKQGIWLFTSTLKH